MAAQVRQFLKNFAINSLVLCGGLVVAVLIGEVTVRLAAPQQLIVMRPDIWTGDDTVGWRVRSNVDVFVNTGERTIRFISDSSGFRSASTGVRSAGDVNVLLIGDSFTQALQVDYAATLGARLEDKLSSALGRKVVVWNAGVDGWNPNQYLLRTRQLLEQSKYDAVLAMFYVDNDIVGRREWRIPRRQPGQTHRFRVPRELSQPELISAVFYPVNDILEENSHLFQLLKKGFATALLRAGLAEPSFPRVIIRETTPDSGWRITGDVAADIAKTAASHGAATVFGIIPAPYQIDPKAFDYYRRGFNLDSANIELDRPQRLLNAEMRPRGLTVVDALSAFRAKADSGALFGSVDRHFTPLGHELMADQLFPALMTALEPRSAEPTLAGKQRGR